MFMTKKHIKTQLDYLLGKCARKEETDRPFKVICEINMNALEECTDQINDLMKTNRQLERDLDQLKRALDLESRQKEELVELLAEAERDAYCPADCKNRKNQDVCRLCTRYPAARDRYEVES